MDERPPWDRPLRRLGAILAVASVIVLADQATKTWALHHLANGPRHLFWTFSLNLQFNTGMAFSQVTGATALVTGAATIVLSVLVVVALRGRGAYTAVVFGLLIGGALGNLADRLVRQQGGAVIDFIDPRWWPVFNIADAAVSVGVVLLVARSLFQDRRAGERVA
jgi:signal peptidase II